MLHSTSWIKLIGLLAASLVLAACVSSPSKKSSAGMTAGEPDWVINEPAKSGHVYGVGSAPVYVDKSKALKQAQDAARMSMVQKLKVTVSGSLTQDIEETRRTGQQTELVKSVRSRIRSEIPNAELDNVEIVENYVDEKDKVAYSLVHLDRVRASSLLRQRIDELDQQAINRAKQVDTTLDTLPQLQQLLPVLTFVEKRERLAEQHQLVDENNRYPQKEEDLIQAEQRVASLLDQLVVRLEATNQDGKTLRSGLNEALTNLGLRISNGNADLTFRYSAELRLSEKAGRFIVFANGQVQIQDANGRILSEFRKESKGLSAVSMQQAQYKAVKTLGRELGNELAASLLSKID